MTEIFSSPVAKARIDRQILLVEFDHPPVNAINHAVRQAIVDSLAYAQAEQARAIIYYAVGRTFFSGADIREFAQQKQDLDLPTTLAQMDQCSIPMLCLLHGSVFGGGLEFALRCDSRLAHGASRLAFPEVNLGLIPGAGGTQLLPRVIGVDASIDMICRGKTIDCAKAKEWGLIDGQIPEKDLNPQVWLEYAIEQILQGNLATTKDRLRDRAAPDLDDQQQENWQREIVRQARGKESPVRALEAIFAGLALPIDEGLSREREIFQACKISKQSKALRYIFFAEKESAKLAATPLPRTTGSDLLSCAVVGCGTMGAGIASALARCGLKVLLVDSQQQTLDRAQQKIAASLDKACQRGQISSTDCQAAKENIRCSEDFADLRDAQLVIEAVFEDKKIKQEVFQEIDRHVSAQTLLASNTSYIDPREIFAGISRPERQLGLHFFSPADIMKLLEIVVLPETDVAVLAQVMALAKKMAKVVVFAKPEFGFVANRTYMAYGQAGQQLLLAGNTPEQIDTAMTDFGMAMGPLAVLDLSGIDIGHHGRAHNPNPSQDPGFFLPAKILFERQELGRKSGIGFYRYENDKLAGVNQAGLEAIWAAGQKLGIDQSPASADAIVQSLIGAIYREGLDLVERQVCQRQSDIDVVWVNGYGFPRWRGGPSYLLSPED